MAAERKRETEEMAKKIPIIRISGLDDAWRRPLHALLVHALQGLQRKPGDRVVLKVNMNTCASLRSLTLYVQLSGDGRRVGSKNHHTMMTVTHMTGDDSDRTPATHMPIALLACGEEYDNLQKAFDIIKPEIDDLRQNGIRYALLDVRRPLMPAVQRVEHRIERHRARVDK